MVSREEIRWAYKSLLGREPESEEAYIHHFPLEDFESLRRAIISSEEGLSSLRKKISAAIGALPFSYFRPVTVFIHIQKTGGTALHEWLCGAIGSAATSDAHMAYLPSYSLGELNQLDLISGHLTYQEAIAIPRDKKRIICSFREPLARLISLYRFYRAHPPGSTGSQLLRLAQTLTPEEFFAAENVRASPEIDNRYLRVFCDGGAQEGELNGPREAALQSALERVSRMEAVAISEQMELSASVIARRFGFANLSPPRRVHATDDLHESTGFRHVQPVVVTNRLRALTAPLIEYDLRIYEYARLLLERNSRSNDRFKALRIFR